MAEYRLVIRMILLNAVGQSAAFRPLELFELIGFNKLDLG